MKKKVPSDVLRLYIQSEREDFFELLRKGDVNIKGTLLKKIK